MDRQSRLSFWIYLLASFFLVAFGQPARISEFGLLAGCLGYALFWRAMLEWPKLKERFFLSLLWYASVQAIHLSWMTSTHYMGSLILGVYVLLLLGLAVQFGLLSCLIGKNAPLSQGKCLGLAGFWVCMEWIRIYLLTGFTWNPTGLSLVGNPFAIQLAALVGIYGLSFWVIWANLAGLNALFLERSRKSQMIWILIAIFPYGFGVGHQALVERFFQPERNLRVALIDTGFTVEEKYYHPDFPRVSIPVMEQWEAVWRALGEGPFDLIVLPETAFPKGAYNPICNLEEAIARWESCHGKGSSSVFPPREYPLTLIWNHGTSFKEKATNAFLAQSLANYYQTEVIIGLDVDDPDKKYNAAFRFSPYASEHERCEKRILAPVGEYVPFSSIQWVADFIAAEFGIGDSFDAGESAKVFSAPIPVGVAICLEETYSDIVRQLRRQGAQLLVGLSNDVWFPSSKLAQQHFDHARVRAVENGMFFLRSTNKGFTGVIDCFGRPIGNPTILESGARAVVLSVPAFSYPTLYSMWGDSAVLMVSLGCFLLFLTSAWRKKKLPLNGSLR